MRHYQRFAMRAAASAALALSIVGLGPSVPRTQAMTGQGQDTVIVVRDATTESQCVMWRGTPTNTFACPAGSVIWRYPMTRADAEANGYRYVVPQATDSATLQAVDQTVRAVQSAARPTTATLSLVTPNYTCPPYGSAGAPGGGHYLSVGGGLTIYYNVQFIYTGGAAANGTCGITNVADQTSASGTGYYWDHSQLHDNATGIDDYVSKGCQRLTTAFTGWQILDGATWSRTQTTYTNRSASGSNCTIFDHYAYGTYGL